MPVLSVGYLNPENMRVSVFDPSIGEAAVLTEPIYKTKYRIDDIDASLIEVRLRLHFIDIFFS